MAVKFGLSEINQPSPPKMKLAVNMIILFLGFANAIILPMPDNWIPMEVKAYIGSVSAQLGALLKGTEKLTGLYPANTKNDDGKG